MKLIRHIRERHRAPQIGEVDFAAGGALALDHGGNIGVEGGLDLGVVRLAAHEQVGDDDLGVGPIRGHLNDQGFEPVDRVGRVVPLAVVVGADEHQDRVWIRNLIEHPQNDGIDLVDAPAGMPFVIGVRQTGSAVVSKGPHKIDIKSCVGQKLVKREPVPARGASAIGNRVAERQDTNSRRG